MNIVVLGAIANAVSCILLFWVGALAGLKLQQRQFFVSFLRRITRHKAVLFCLVLSVYSCAAVLVMHLPQIQSVSLGWSTLRIQDAWVLLRSLFFCLCGVVTAFAWKTSRRQVIAIVAVCCAGMAIWIGLECYLLTPIHHSLANDVRSQGIVKQTSDSSCAPAALATVLNQWQIKASEPEVAKFAGTSRVGTSTPQLIVAAQQFGMDGLELRPSWETIQQINRPGVLSIWLLDGERRLPHAVALLKMNDNVAVIADPSEGKAFIVDRPSLEEIWRQEYVPIFRPQDVTLTIDEARQYLTSLGYGEKLADQSPLSLFRGKRHSFQAALEEFQSEMPGLQQTGKLDPETVLALTGAFAQQTPTLDLNDIDQTVQDFHNYGA